MNDKQNEKPSVAGPKSFLSVGPTLHYSHKYVQRCWVGALSVYCLCCLFWSKILTGVFLSFHWTLITNFEMWRLGRFVIEPVSIFEYPWQILVLGLLMGVIAYAPTLVAQLMSFRHSFPFVLAVFFLAALPVFALAVLISCLAAASRPLRFRSRFIAIALCIAPQFIYWGLLGGIRGVEPVKWGFSFAPWVCAWLVGLVISGLVLGAGHFTRYRPGLVLSSTAIVLVATFLVFDFTVGFDELDYQLWVAGNNPKEAIEFHDHSIKEALDETIMNEGVRTYLAGFFYPTEDRIALRIKLKEKIQSQLRLDRWPSWFEQMLPDELKYQDKRQFLDRQYDKFIQSRPKSPRMPITLYYKAMLSEINPDVEKLSATETLHFYSDYPFERSRQLWYRLYLEFPKSPESIESRWRIAKHWAGVGMFEQVDALLAEAQMMVKQRLEQSGNENTTDETLSRIFVPPPESALTRFDLEQLQFRLNLLSELIGKQNRGPDKDSQGRLATFVMLNPYAEDYESNLDELLSEMGKDDPLRDNVLLEKTCLIPDEQHRAEEYANLHRQFENTDGGIAAFYDLALLKISFWRQQDQGDVQRKKELLVEAGNALSEFVKMYPDNFRTHLARQTLSKLPAVPAD
jgi:uncharacterized membrane protein YhaH (DUF805 family)